jgi:hypothetical protein
MKVGGQAEKAAGPIPALPTANKLSKFDFDNFTARPTATFDFRHAPWQTPLLTFARM